MPKEYRLTRMRRLVNSMAASMANRGKGQSWVLSTVGSKSGERRDVVVTPVDIEGQRYLVAPYGPRPWVGNLRANPTATLSRGGAAIRLTAVEITGEEAGRALARYYAENKRYVGAYMDIAGDGTITDFTAAVERYPVFRVET